MLPVSVDEAGVDVVAALDAPERLEAHAAGLEGEDVDQTVLELVHREVGRHKPGDTLEFEVFSWTIFYFLIIPGIFVPGRFRLDVGEVFEL